MARSSLLAICPNSTTRAESLVAANPMGSGHSEKSPANISFPIKLFIPCLGSELMVMGIPNLSCSASFCKLLYHSASFSVDGIMKRLKCLIFLFITISYVEEKLKDAGFGLPKISPFFPIPIGGCHINPTLSSISICDIISFTLDSIS